MKKCKHCDIFDLEGTKISDIEVDNLGSFSGELTDIKNNKKYSYLYYEAEGNIEYDLSKGFIVKGQDTADFLEEKLEIMGLNYKERNDFITYWLPRLEENKYNLIHFSEEEYQNECKLNISPQPDTTIRVYMVFKAIEKPINIQEQIIKPVNREGYTVVEWGGTKLYEQ